MPLHPVAEVLVKALDDAGVGFYSDTTPESMRTAMSALAENGLAGQPPVHEVTDSTLPGPDGEIPLRV